MEGLVLLILAQYDISPKAKFLGFGITLNPQFQGSMKGYMELAYTTFVPNSLVGFSVGSWIHFGDVVPRTLDPNADTLTYNVGGLTFFLGPTFGKTFFNISPVLGFVTVSPLTEGRFTSFIGARIALIEREGQSLISAYVGYTTYLGKRYDALQFVSDTVMKNFTFAVAINPLFFTNTYPFREWSPEIWEKYYHGADLPEIDERNNFALSFKLSKMFAENTAYDYILEFSWLRYFATKRYGNEFTLGIRKVNYNYDYNTFVLPSIAYFKVRPFFGREGFDVGPYFAIGYVDDGKLIRAGAYDVGIELRLDAFVLDIGALKAFEGPFYEPSKTILRGEYRDVPHRFRDYLLFPSKLIPKFSMGFRYQYEEGKLKSPFLLNPQSKTFLFVGFNAGIYTENYKELKFNPVEVMMFRYIGQKAYGLALGFQFESVERVFDTLKPKIKEPRFAFKLGPTIGGKGASITLYGLVGSAFYPTDLMYGGGLKLTLATYGKLFRIPFYVLTFDLVYANNFVYENDTYRQKFMLGIKFGISYHIPIYRMLKSRLEEELEPIRPGDFE